MPEPKIKQLKQLNRRARMPVYFRVMAVSVVAVTMVLLGVGFYRARSNTDFRMKGFPALLSQEITAVVNGYERRETEGEAMLYYIKADKATTFSDNHQELENVYLEVFDQSGGGDRISAAKAVYIPEENKNFTAYFAGNVDIETRDGLKVQTEQVTYRKADETALADEGVEFVREGVKGRSYGAIVHIPQKKIELLRDVEIETFDSAEAPGSNQSVMRAGYASYDQPAEKIDLTGGVVIDAASPDRSANVRSERAAVILVKTGSGREAGKLELFDNVRIVTRQPGSPPANITSGYAVYEKNKDRFDLKNGVHIVTAEDARPVNITSSSAAFEQRNNKVVLDGSAEITQGSDVIKGDHIVADLYPSRKLKHSIVRGNAYLRQAAQERTTEIAAFEMNAAFSDTQQISSANAFGSANAVLTPADPVDYTKVTVSSPTAIRVGFRGEGLLDRVFTEGRTTIKLDVPNSGTDAANKRVTADAVKTFFDAEGRNIQKAEAVGNAELYVEPLQARPENYRTTVTAPRFDCEFFPKGNNARSCIAATKTRTVRVPTVPNERGDQVLTADRLTAAFNGQTKDVERLDAEGSAKFTERDRNAISERMSFTTGDAVARLRGGEPTAWDSKARAKAREIDWNTREQRSSLRGGVSTTYYSQSRSGGTTPFGDGEKPVFLTGDNAEFDHREESAVYSGNARGWQENNYVRADRLHIRTPQGRFIAEGGVQSLLYNARRKENGRETSVPVHASAKRMTYDRDTRLLRYEQNVDIRQGTDRIVAGIANVYLTDRSEVARTDVENNVVVTQPNRRAAGDWAQYLAAEERIVLRGSPARVEDAGSGSSQGAELTVYLRENRVVGEGKTRRNAAGRTRSVYKIKND